MPPPPSRLTGLPRLKLSCLLAHLHHSDLGRGLEWPGRHLPSQTGTQPSRLRLSPACWATAGATPGRRPLRGRRSYLSFRLSMKRLVKALTLSTRAP